MRLPRSSGSTAALQLRREADLPAAVSSGIALASTLQLAAVNLMPPPVTAVLNVFDSQRLACPFIDCAPRIPLKENKSHSNCAAVLQRYEKACPVCRVLSLSSW